MSAAPPASARWLFGRAPDLLLGCGLWYSLALALFAFQGAEIRSGGGRALLPFLVLLFGTPHYGATLLRVYERREDRRAYAFFALWATAAVALAFAVGVYSSLVGSLLVTVYLTWSPWHYSGQNYGIAVMFLRKRGVPLPPATKRLLYASFLLSYALTFIAIHSGARAESYAPLGQEYGGYRFLPLGLPASIANVTFALTAAAYAATLVAAAILLLRRAPLRDLAPAAALVLTQALWFSVPLALRTWQVQTGLDAWEADGTYYFLWIAIGHSVQYVWITAYYARNSTGFTGYGAYFSKVMLAGALAWTLPALLFSPGLLGRLPFESGLGLLVAAAVNVHHFILDGAIWKLRDGRVARVLLRPREPGSEPIVAPGGLTRWGRRAVWATGVACLAVMFAAKWEREFGVTRAAAAGDTARIRKAVERLAWVGRDSPSLRVALARALGARGEILAARLEFQRALELRPSAGAWHALGSFYAGRKQWRRAAEAYEAGLALEPDQPTLLHQLGVARLELREPGAARDAFLRASELEPDHELHRLLLERAQRELRAAEGQDAAAAGARTEPCPGDLS